MHLLANTGERALVIGAGGVLGSLTGAAFECAGWEVLRGSRVPADRPDWLRIDLDLPETVVSALERVDVVVNTVPDARLVAEQAVLERGGVLLNAAALPSAQTPSPPSPPSTPAGTVVLGAGLAPGLTDLIAAQLLAAHPDADQLELVFTLSAAATVGPAGAEAVRRHLAAVRGHDTVAVPLPPPFGARRCLAFAQQLGATAELVAPRAVRSYLCIGEVEVHGALLAGAEGGATPDLAPDAFAGSAGENERASSEPVADWVCVRRQGARVAARTIRCAGRYMSAARATVALAQALQDARARAPLPRGVFGPQELVTLAELDPYLAAGGITFVSESV